MKIDQSISIVFETEQIADRRNSPLNSRARISDGSGIRFFVVSGKIYLDRSMRYHASEQSSGSEGVITPGYCGMCWRAVVYFTLPIASNNRC